MWRLWRKKWLALIPAFSSPPMNQNGGRAGSPLHAVVATPKDERILTTADRGSLAPQRGEGPRVRGETT
jgi:hypothetical protein